MSTTTEPSHRPWLARLLAVATLAYTALLVFATHHPRPEEFLGPNPPPDKTLHFLAYGALATLATATWLTARRTAVRGVGGLAIALAAFGGLYEVTQPLFRRSAEPLDWVFDCIGIAVGVAAVAGVVAVTRRLRHRG